MHQALSRNVPIEPRQTTLLFVDVQKYNVDSSVRDACDLVTVPTDACVTLSAERQGWSLRNNAGYCRQWHHGRTAHGDRVTSKTGYGMTRPESR